MPHLAFDHSPGLEARVDLAAFARAMRDALAATGVFPLGGIRVRGHRADWCAIADGRDAHAFLDLRLRMGEGRDEATRRRVAEAVYAAAEAFLRPAIGTAPFMLSLEVEEIAAAFSVKRWSTVHDAIREATP